MPNVIALSFHVDYWNNGGWHDKFTLNGATDRQRAYAQKLKVSEVFTPQVVIDGSSSLVGSDKAKILGALANANTETVPVTVAVSDGTLNVSVPDSPSHEKYTVFVAAYLPQASTPVGRGENTGKSLEEFNIVRQFRSIGNWKGQAAVFRASVQSFPADASRVAVLVQRADQGPIAGSATIALR